MEERVGDAVEIARNEIVHAVHEAGQPNLVRLRRVLHSLARLSVNGQLQALRAVQQAVNRVDVLHNSSHRVLVDHVLHKMLELQTASR